MVKHQIPAFPLFDCKILRIVLARKSIHDAECRTHSKPFRKRKTSHFDRYWNRHHSAARQNTNDAFVFAWCFVFCRRHRNPRSLRRACANLEWGGGQKRSWKPTFMYRRSLSVTVEIMTTRNIADTFPFQSSIETDTLCVLQFPKLKTDIFKRSGRRDQYLGRLPFASGKI